MGPRRQVGDEGERDPVGIELLPGASGATLTRAPSTTNRASTGWRSKRPSAGRSASGGAPHRARPAAPRRGFVVTSAASVATGSTAVASRKRTSRGPSRRRVTRPAPPEPVRRRRRERRPQRHTELGRERRRPRRSAARSTSVPGAGFEIEMDAVSASMTRSAFRGCSPKRRSSRFASSAAAPGRAGR